MSVIKYHPTTREFVAEQPPAAEVRSEVTVEMLELRLRQQQILADFGVLAHAPTEIRPALRARPKAGRLQTGPGSA